MKNNQCELDIQRKCMLSDIINIFIKFLKDAKFSIFITSMFIIVTYWIRVVSFSFGIDTELYIRDNLGTYTWWSSLGRWGGVILNELLSMGSLIVPFSNILTLLFILLYSILFCFLFYLLLNENNRVYYAHYCFVFPIIFTTSPIFAEQYNFTNQNAAVSLAICMIAFSLIILNTLYIHNNKRTRVVLFFICIIFITLSFGTYQSNILLYILCVVCCYLLKCMCENNLNWKYLITNILLFLLCSLCYYLVSKLFGYGNNYLNTGWRDNGVICFKYIAEVIISTLRCDTIFYNIGYPIAIIVIIFSNLVLLFENRFNVGVLIGSIALISSPFYINIVTGVDQLKRTQFNYSFMIGFSILFFILIIMQRNLLKKLLVYILVCFSVLISCKQSYISAALFYSQDVVYKSDCAFTTRIETEIENSEWYSPLKKYKIVFIGKRDNQPLNRFFIGEVIGYSVYEFDYQYYWGVTDRANVLFMTNGYYYNRPSIEEYTFAKDYVIKNNIPVFPLSGSIINYNDLIIVRLSENI